jgi:hypothetical protein
LNIYANLRENFVVLLSVLGPTLTTVKVAAYLITVLYFGGRVGRAKELFRVEYKVLSDIKFAVFILQKVGRNNRFFLFGFKLL